MVRWWPQPLAGDIVWCHFPDHIHPRPKPWPALVLAVFDDESGHFNVRVAYGTSQKTDRLYKGEFLVARPSHPAAYEAAGLSYDTKFNLRQQVDLPYSSDWFSVPTAAPHGQVPRLGTLHPSLVRVAAAADQAARA